MIYRNRIVSLMMAGMLAFSSISLPANATELSQTSMKAENEVEIEPASEELAQDNTASEEPAQDVNPSQEENPAPEDNTTQEETASQEENPAPEDNTTQEETAAEEETTEAEEKSEEEDKDKKDKELIQKEEPQEEEVKEEIIQSFREPEKITTHYKLALDSLKEKFPQEITAVTNQDNEITIRINEWKSVSDYDEYLGEYTFEPVFETEYKIAEDAKAPVLMVDVEDESNGPTGLIDTSRRSVPSVKEQDLSKKNLLRASALDSSYNAYEEGNLLPDIRSQGTNGACWAFAAMGAVEACLIKNGDANTNIDLSELQLAYFTAHEYEDAKGLRVNDHISYTSNKSYLDNGGNDIMASQAFLNNVGPIEEKYMPYSLGSSYDAESSYAQESNYAQIKDVYEINVDDTNVIKQAILDYGAVDAAVYFGETSMSHYSATYNSMYGTANVRNHAVTLVGWDDDFPKTNFEKLYPKSNGAWLVRNSWGLNDYGRNGYFWMSYEDASFKGSGSVVAYSASTEKYDNVYSYAAGESLNVLSFYSVGTPMTYWVDYDVYGGETIKSVSVPMENTNARIDVSVTVGDTTSTGGRNTETAGCYNVVLETPIEVTEQSNARIMVKITPPSGQTAKLLSENAPEDGVILENIIHYVKKDHGYKVGSKYDTAVDRDEDTYVRLYTDNTGGTTPDPTPTTGKLEITTAPIEDYRGTTHQITLSAESVTTNPADVTWKTINKDVATVDESGLITVGAKKGSTIISGTYNETYTASIMVTVKPRTITYNVDTADTLSSRYKVYYPGDSANCKLPKYCTNTSNVADLGKSGYKLVGFTTDAENENPITETMLLNKDEDLTLYPKWEEYQITLKYYNLNEDGIGYDTDTSTIATVPKLSESDKFPYRIPVNDECVRDPNTGVPAGLKFSYWSVDEGGKSIITEIPASKYDAVKNPYLGRYVVEDEIILYPQYKADGTCKIRYNTNKGTLPEGASTTKRVRPGNAYGELPTPVRKSYEFTGWHLNTKTGDLVTSETIVAQESDHTLVATWKYVEGDESAEVVIDETVMGPELLSPTATTGLFYGELVRLASGTELANIYYSISDGTDVEPAEPSTSTNSYTEPIELKTENAKDNIITIKAVAIKGNNKSDIVSYSFSMIPADDDWGDIDVTDKAQWTTATAVPEGMWISEASMCDNVDEGEKPDGTMDYTGKQRRFTDLRVYHHTRLLTEGEDYTISYSNNVKARSSSDKNPPIVRIVGRGQYTQSFEQAFTINKLKLVGTSPITEETNAYMTMNDQYVATGRPIKANGVKLYFATVSEDGKTIIQDKQVSSSLYTLKFYDTYSSEQANTALSEKAGEKCAVITMKGNYEGTIIGKYNVVEKEKAFVRNATVKVTPSKMPWNPVGEAPEIQVTDKTKKAVLNQGTDYEVEVIYYGTGTYGDVVEGTNYRKKIYSDASPIILSSAGKYDLNFKSKGAYGGYIKKTVTVTGKKLAIRDLVANNQWTGEAVVPLYNVTNGGNLVTNSELVQNYTVELTDNVGIGRAMLTIIGNADLGWDGTPVKKYFNIVGEKLTSKNINIANAYMVFNKTIYNKESIGLNVTNSAGQTLTEDKDYILRIYDKYVNEDSIKNVNATVNAGTKTVVITGINGYWGVAKKTFKVQPYNMNADSETRLTIDVANATMLKSGAKPVVTIVDKDDKNGTYTLAEGKDFTLSMSRNKAISSYKNQPLVTIKGKGNYTNLIIRNFDITRGDLDNARLIVGAVQEGRFKNPSVTVDLGGALSKGANRDCEVSFFVKNSDSWVTLSAKSSVYEGDEILTLAVGHNNYAGNSYTITKVVKKGFNLANGSFAIAPQQYTGNKIHIASADITKATLGNTALKYGKDYVIDENSYVKNVKKGTAMVTLRGIGNYSGIKTVSFKINPVSMYYALQFLVDSSPNVGSNTVTVFSARVGANKTGVFRLPGASFTVRDSSGKSVTKEYTFDGWYTAGGQSVGQKGTLYDAKAFIGPGETLTLYGRFKRK